MKRFAVSALVALGLCSTAAVAAPNLVPGVNVKTGVVSVSNTGAATAAPSLVTVKCTAQGGSCPDPTAAQAAPYTFPGFPNVAGIKVPKLIAGGNFNHKISFFSSLTFTPGGYYFTVCVDAAKTVEESKEGDNCRRFRKVVRRSLTPPGIGVSVKRN
ncbi:CARDB domain-containing protein [Halovulum sp. GXIMD14793]